MKEMINTAYLLIGGNMGDRIYNLNTAAEKITIGCGNIAGTSAIYETEAWGKTDQPLFLNRALRLQTALEPDDLLYMLLQIEKSMGRKRVTKYDPRIIDIDILFFNDAIIDTINLQVPHPHIAQRRFVLQPMAEIAPNLIHPVLKKTVLDLLKRCTDPLGVYTFIQ